jgi:hypothetical protein
MPTKTPRKKSKKAQRQLTIKLDEEVYTGLHSKFGRHNLSRFIETLLRPYVIHKEMQEAYRQMEEQRRRNTTGHETLVRPVVTKKDLDKEYRQMAADKVREAEAREWCEALIGDVADETR